MVGSDHFHQLWLDNMPQFLIGKAPTFDANWYNEEREFGLPRMTLSRSRRTWPPTSCGPGWTPISIWPSATSCGSTTRSTCPIITLRPDADLPIVPIYTNIFAPPLPQPRRFVALGRAIREMVESWPSDLRVAIIGTGHLSLELGDPRHAVATRAPNHRRDEPSPVEGDHHERRIERNGREGVDGDAGRLPPSHVVTTLMPVAKCPMTCRKTSGRGSIASRV